MYLSGQATDSEVWYLFNLLLMQWKNGYVLHLKFWSWDIILSVVTGVWAGCYGFQIGRFFPPVKHISLVVGHTHPLAHLVQVVQQPGYEIDYLRPSSAEIKRDYCCICVSPGYLHCLHRDNFISTHALLNILILIWYAVNPEVW
jgi:hypothetical protein